MHRTRSSLLVLLAFGLLNSLTSAAELTSEQRAVLLGEATAAYGEGLRLQASDVAAAKDAFATAAEKYRLLIDSGIDNPRLYDNLGNASLQSGRLGPALAVYEHAAVLAPSDARIRQHLDHARSLREGGISAAADWPLIEYVARWNQSLPAVWLFAAAAVAWTLLWGCLVARLFVYRRSLTQAATAAAAVALLAAASLGWQWTRMPTRPFGVITSPAVVRTHNGETFPPMFERPLSEGTRFDVRERRGEWLQLELPDGATGWIPIEAAEVIPAPATAWLGSGTT